MNRAFDLGHALTVLSPPRDDAAYEVPRSGWPSRPPADSTSPVPPAPAPIPGPAAAPAETDRAAAPDDVSADEVAADIAAIIAAGRPTTHPDPPAAEEPPPGVPPGNNRQDIFDQIAASMTRARSYDLGSIELEQRFDDFDRLAEATGPQTRAAGVSRRQPGVTEVLQDLDAIRSRAAEKQPSAIPLDPGIGGRSIDASALEPGDIILSTTDHPLSERIRAVTGSEVSHAAVHTGEGRVVEAIDGGVVLRSLEAALADDSLAVAYRHRDMSPSAAARLIPFLEDHARRRTPFDRWGLIRVAPGQLARTICNRLDGEERRRCLASAGSLRVGTDDDDAFFCSELVLAAFAEAGLSVSTLEPAWSSPGQIVDLHHNGLLDYVGHLKG